MKQLCILQNSTLFFIHYPKKMIKTKTYRIPHPQYANMLVEMDVEEEMSDEPEFLGSNGGGTEVPVKLEPGLAKAKPVTGEPGLPAGEPGLPRMDPESALGENVKHRTYIFLSMFCNALGVQDIQQLLKDSSLSWENQRVGRRRGQNESDDQYFDYVLSFILSGEIYGAIHRGYQRLSPEMMPGITVRDLILSPVTSDTFAAFCALLCKGSTGSFAQPGRLYTGTGRQMYYVNSGNERHRQLAKQTASHIFWFRGVRKYGQGELYYQMPERHSQFMASVL